MPNDLCVSIILLARCRDYSAISKSLVFSSRRARGTLERDNSVYLHSSFIEFEWIITVAPSGQMLEMSVRLCSNLDISSISKCTLCQMTTAGPGGNWNSYGSGLISPHLKDTSEAYHSEKEECCRWDLQIPTDLRETISPYHRQTIRMSGPWMPVFIPIKRIAGASSCESARCERVEDVILVRRFSSIIGPSWRCQIDCGMIGYHLFNQLQLGGVSLLIFDPWSPHI